MCIRLPYLHSASAVLVPVNQLLLLYRFDDFGPFWVFIIFGPLETLIVLLMISLEIGFVPAICGVGTLLAIVPLQAGLAGKNAGLRTLAAGFTDERVRVTGALHSLPLLVAGHLDIAGGHLTYANQQAHPVTSARRNNALGCDA